MEHNQAVKSYCLEEKVGSTIKFENIVSLMPEALFPEAYLAQ